MAEINYTPTFDQILNNPKFWKAFFLTLIDEFNRLRAKAGMPQITPEQVVDQIKAKMKTL